MRLFPCEFTGNIQCLIIKHEYQNRGSKELQSTPDLPCLVSPFLPFTFHGIISQMHHSIYRFTRFTALIIPVNQVLTVLKYLKLIFSDIIINATNYADLKKKWVNCTHFFLLVLVLLFYPNFPQNVGLQRLEGKWFSCVDKRLAAYTYNIG